MHDNINHFLESRRIKTLVHEEIPDAQDHLNHVINLVQDAGSSLIEIIKTSEQDLMSTTQVTPNNSS